MAGVLSRLFVTFAGMLGLRFDLRAWNPVFIVWFVLFFVTVYAYGHIFIWGGIRPSHARPWAIGYAAVIWLVYYGGLALVLGTRLRLWMIHLWGEENAQLGFNAMLGLVFLHQGLAQGAVIDCTPGTLAGLPIAPMKAAALALIVLGTGVKVWATYASSLDIYYYNDMFVGRPLKSDAEAYSKGPFRWFKNPMYGVGNLQGYGSALLVGSLPGLAVAGIYHATVYAFYFILERPFVARIYAAASTSR
jgi:protein-S-isoprenylcysteine O-methyltransferase Ste14